MKKLLPTYYFLLTITFPQGLRDIVRSHQKQSYGALFSCTHKALKKLARDTRFVGSDRIGYLAALHTWGGMKKAGLLDKIDPAVWKQQWVIDSQAAGQGQNSLRYLSRYVFRVAISNNRIKSIENDVIKFLYKDRAKKKWKPMVLSAIT